MKARASTLIAMVAVLALGVGSAAAQSQGGWREGRTVDQMDGTVRFQVSRASSSTIRDSVGQSGAARLIVRCSRAPNRRGRVEVFVTFPSELFVSFGENRVRTRLGDGDVEESVWEATRDRRALRWGRPEIIFRFSEAATLHAEFAPPLSSRQYTQFDLGGAADAIGRVLDACTLSGAELGAYNSWAAQQLESAWDANLRSDYLSDYGNVYRGLQRVGALSGRPMSPGSVTDRPLPNEEVLAALMGYMRSSGRCIYPPERQITDETLALGPTCPLDMPTRQAGVFFRTGDEHIQDNTQWTLSGN